MKILFVNQTFSPDHASTAQYLHDLCKELVNEGHEVQVACSRHGYLSGQKYPPHEIIDDIDVRRFFLPGFPRSVKLFRILNMLFGNLALALAVLRLPRPDVLVSLTTPPLLHWFLLPVCWLKRSPLVLWAMDVNPEQAIRYGWFQEHGLFAGLLKSLDRFALKRLQKIVVLDEAMKKLLTKNGARENSIEVLPLWANGDELFQKRRSAKEHRAPFAREEDTLVMYSGNLSICHPLQTLLDLSLCCKDEAYFRFLVRGGGPRRREIQDFKKAHPALPLYVEDYVPREQLASSLSAADIHVVSMGDDFVGVVHPSKVYPLLLLGKPILYLGPREGGTWEILQECAGVWQVDHGDVDGAKKALDTLRSYDEKTRHEIMQELQQRGKQFERERMTARFSEFLSEFS